MESFSLHACLMQMVSHSSGITQQQSSLSPSLLWLLLHPFNSLFSRTNWVSQYQKDNTSMDFNEARDYGV